jgi:hypothetical protein
VDISPRREELVLDLQCDRRRTEGRRESRHALWPNGPRVTYYEPHSALIEICENGTSKAFSLDLDHRTYAPIEMSQNLSPERVKAFQDHAPKLEVPTRPHQDDIAYSQLRERNFFDA